MNYRHFKYEGWLYGLAFLLAIGMRLIQLGAMPLNDAEAAPALEALRIAQGLKPALGPHPFYILSTSVLFFLYGGGTNFLARFIPALVGSLLVFAPLLFADRIKPRPSLLLAFFIALDPGMIYLSRHAGTSILAITFSLFTIGFLYKKNLMLAGISAAFALLSGPSIWVGLLGLALAWALQQALEFRSESASHFSIFPLDLKPLWLPFFTALLLAGTLFFIVPNGLSAALGSIPAYLATWRGASSVPSSRVVLSLLVYQPFPVLLTVIALLRGWWNGSKRIIPLSIWFLVSLLLAIFNPSREVTDLGWALIPLLAIASLELARSFDIFPDERIEVIGVSLLTAFIWAFAWLDLSGLIWATATPDQYSLRVWLLIGAFLLLIISLLLVAAGWSIRTAKLGGIWGFAIALGILGFGGALGAAGFRGLDHPELWRPNQIPVQADLLRSTVRELSEWGRGNDFAAPVIIAGVNSPALEWALREHDVQVAETLDVATAPYFVITPLQDNPELASAYRGQDFVWRQDPDWSTAQSYFWMRWLALREMAQTNESIILWAREDLFLDK